MHTEVNLVGVSEIYLVLGYVIVFITCLNNSVGRVLNLVLIIYIYILKKQFKNSGSALHYNS